MPGFEWNKIIAAILLAALVAMFAGFIAKKTVHPEKLEKSVYVVAGVPATGASSAPAAPAGPEPIDALLASADIAAGAQTAKQCAACHTFQKGEPAHVGPNLWGIVGNVHAHMPGFSYSDAMQALHDKKWDYDALNQFIYSPRDTIKGTKMTFAGLKDTKQRANVIAWLRTLSDSPVPLPKVEPAAPPATSAPAQSPQQPAQPAPQVQPSQQPAKPAPQTQSAPQPATPAPQAQSPQQPAKPAPQAQPPQQPGASSAPAAPTGPEPIDALLASADIAAGAQTAKQCAACHTFQKGEPAHVGPNLWGIVGNVHAHMPGFSYSDAMQALHDKKWDYDALNQFIYSPRDTIKGTKMTFAGLKDTKQRANVIAWLRTLSDSPVPLPKVEPAAPPATSAPAQSPQQPAQPAPQVQPSQQPAKPAPQTQSAPQPATPAPQAQSPQQPAKPAPQAQPPQQPATSAPPPGH